MLFPTVYDTFARTTASGWGTSDSGTAWAGSGAVYSTTAGVAGSINLAKHFFASASTAISSLPVTLADVDIRVQVGVGAFATGAKVAAALLGRFVDANNHYRMRLDFNTDQVLGWGLEKFVAGVSTSLGSGLVGGGYKQVNNGRYWMRLKITGTTLQGKVWSDAVGEPTTWLFTVTDSAIATASGVGLASLMFGGNTNVNYTFSYSYFTSAPYVYRDGKAAMVDVDFAPGADLTADAATWQWTTIDNKVRHAGQITLTGGRGDGATQAEPAGGGLVLDNRAGDFTADNPVGVYYPNIGPGVPFRIRTMVSLVRGIRFADDFVPAYDTSGKDAVAAVPLGGVMKRLNQGKSPLDPPYKRTVATPFGKFGILAYAFWPLNEGNSATQAGSGLIGGQPMTIRGAPGFGVSGGPQGNAVDLAPGCTLTGNPVTVDTSRVRFEFLARFAVGAGGGDTYVVDLIGTNGTYQVAFNSSGILRVFSYVAGGTSATQLFSGNPYDGLWHHYRFTLDDNAGNLTDAVDIDGVSKVSFGGWTWGVPLGTQTAIRLSPLGTGTSLMPQVQCLAVVQPFLPGGVDSAAAALGYFGELAGTRMMRVCAEQGVPITVVGELLTVPMGIQPAAPFMEILNQCADADGGILVDGQGAGLLYVARASLYNQTAAIILDRVQGHIAPPYKPDSNIQKRRNDWKVSRTNGSSAEFILTETVAPGHPMTTKRIGLFDEAATINNAYDADLPYHCQWRVHLGTTKGYRYPQFSINLAHRTAGPALVGPWTDAGISSLMTVTHPPSQEAPDDILSIIEGYGERLDFYTWDIVANCSPGRPWEVFKLDHPRLGRLNSDGVTLSIGYSAGAASLVVNVVGPLIGTAADTFDVDIAGERVTVTAVSGTGPQTLAVTRAVNGVSKAQLSGAVVRAWRPGTPGL